MGRDVPHFNNKWLAPFNEVCKVRVTKITKTVISLEVQFKRHFFRISRPQLSNV